MNRKGNRIGNENGKQEQKKLKGRESVPVSKGFTLNLMKKVIFWNTFKATREGNFLLTPLSKFRGMKTANPERPLRSFKN